MDTYEVVLAQEGVGGIRLASSSDVTYRASVQFSLLTALGSLNTSY